MSTALAHQAGDDVLITVTLAPTSGLFHDPDGLAIHPLIRRLGHVGELQDVQLLGVPKGRWPGVQSEVLEGLNGLPGVLRVDVQEQPRQRAKRGGDEL